MALYSVKRFKRTGSTVQDSGSPVVTNDFEAILKQHGQPHYDKAKIEALRVGESSVVALIMDADQFHMIRDGYRITKLPDFQSGVIMFDMLMKEHVKISNGICVLDHSSTEGYAATHAPDCVYKPHEGIALRPWIAEDGDVTINWVYRHVEAADLVVLTPADQEQVQKRFDLALNPPKELRKRFRGRA
jgi:hypothetical protein